MNGSWLVWVFGGLFIGMILVGGINAVMDSF